jgi:hypothetical protein
METPLGDDFRWPFFFGPIMNAGPSQKPQLLAQNDNLLGVLASFLGRPKRAGAVARSTVGGISIVES